jgi:hypothetical protein
MEQLSLGTFTAGLSFQHPEHGNRRRLTMGFSGTLADIDAALDGMSYTPTALYGGSATLSIVTSDQGNTGIGGPQTTRKRGCDHRAGQSGPNSAVARSIRPSGKMWVSAPGARR